MNEQEFGNKRQQMEFTQVMLCDISLKVKKQDQTLRQILKEQIRARFQIDRFQLFAEYPHEEYPELAVDYLNIIDFPVCLNVISEKLLTGSQYIPYSLFGDVLQHLCLISSNCRQYNSTDQVIGEICAEFEAQVLQLYNDVVRRIDHANAVQKSYQQLQILTFTVWPPGRVPPLMRSTRRQMRVPYREEVDLLLQYLSRLPIVRQTQLITSLLYEVSADSSQNIKLSQSCQILGTSATIDFAQLRPATFQWFQQLVEAHYRQTAKQKWSDAEGLEKVAESFQKLKLNQQNDTYQRSNLEEEKKAILFKYAHQMRKEAQNETNEIQEDESN